MNKGKVMQCRIAAAAVAVQHALWDINSVLTSGHLTALTTQWRIT